ncbi:MAG TPA: flavin reductase family protein [Geobacterales bacterium]|nr:flavin reductase family protein [Geobacterales bacterium]
MISTEEFRELMSYFATGVTIVAMNLDGKLYGLTVNSFTSVSLEPMLVLFCIKKGNKAHEMVSKAKTYSINILAEDQEELSIRFADPKLEDVRFEGISYSLNEYGCPIIKGCIAYITCRKYLEYDGGDHTIFLCSVLGLKKGDDKPPLIFYRRGYRRIKT